MESAEVAVTRKLVDVEKWLTGCGPKYPQAAVNVPNIRDRIAAGLRAERDLVKIEDRIRRIAEDLEDAEKIHGELIAKAEDLAAVKALLEPIANVLP